MANFLRDNGVDLQGISSQTIGDSHFFDDVIPPERMKEFLDSSKESDKLKGMKGLLAMLSKGIDVSEFFPDVVKNVVVKSIEVKKMVYVYLVHYADFNSTCREIALLSINSFQKDLSGSNQLIRGLALRVMTSIRVPDIIQIQLLAVRKCATDSSPYVRKCAATAMTKVNHMDSEQLPQLKQILAKLLHDQSTMVLGSALSSFSEMCPNSLELLHRPYRKICHLLADLDEWSQIVALDVLTKYVRNQFTDPAPGMAAAALLKAKQRSASALKGRIGTTVKRRVVRRGFYSDEEDESEEEEVEVGIEGEQPKIGKGFLNPLSPPDETEGDFDPDHRLVLRTSLPLLKSRNSGVVLGVCALHFYCGSRSSTASQQIAKALVRILRNKREIQYVVLNAIHTFVKERPLIFRPFLPEFFVKPSDPLFNKLVKLEILTSICGSESVSTILSELQVYIKHPNPVFVCACVRAVGSIVDAEPSVLPGCMEGLMQLLCSTKNEEIIAEVLVVVRQMMQQQVSSSAPTSTTSSVSNEYSPLSEKSTKILIQLAKLLISEDGVEVSKARSSIVWLIGEFYPLSTALSKVVPDILRILAAGFIEEDVETKMQIVNFATKLALRKAEDEKVQSLMTYVLEMARYDQDTDLRDRARFMTAMLGLAPSNDNGEGEDGEGGSGAGGGTGVDEDALSELAEHSLSIMTAPKLPPVTLLGSVDVEGLPNFNVGSLSSLVNHYAAGYQPLPLWPDIQPDPNVRDTIRLGKKIADEDFGGEGGSDGEDEMERFRDRSGERSASHRRGEDLDSGFYASDDDQPKPSRRPDSSSSDSSSSSDDSSDSSSDSDSSSSDSSDSSDSSASSESESDSSDESSDEESTSRSRIQQAKRGTRVPLTQQQAGRTIKRVGAGSTFAVTSSTKSSTSTSNASSSSNPFSIFGDDLLLIPSSSSSTSSSSSNLSSSSLSPSSSSNQLSDSLASLSLSGKNTPFPSISSSSSSSSTSQLDFDLDSLAGFSSLLPSGSSYPGGTLSPSSPTSLTTSSTSETPSTSSDPYFLAFSQQASSSGSYPSQTSLNSSSSSTAMNLGGMGAGAGGAGGGAGGGMNFNLNNFSLNSPIFPPTPPSSNPASALSDRLSDPRILLRPELGGGLSLSVCFRFSAQPSMYIGASCLTFVLKNCRDTPIRRIKISLPAAIRHSPLEDLPILNPGQELKCPLEVVLTGMAGKPIRIDVRSDQGAFLGNFQAESYDLLSIPSLPWSALEFEAQRKTLKGSFSETSRVFTLDSLKLTGRSPLDVEKALVLRVQALMNLAVVQGPGFGATAAVGELMFVGLRKREMGGEDRVLLTLTLDPSQSVVAQLNCDDPLMGTSLLDLLRKQLPLP